MNGLPLWLLTRHNDLGWEECHAQVVAAPDEATARRIASENSYGEGPGVWHSGATCDQIAAASTYETSKVVLSKEAT